MMEKPDLSKLEEMVAEAEAKASDGRPTHSSLDQHPDLRASRERASTIVIDALGLSNEDRVALDRLTREHDAELRRLADDSKQVALEGSAAASRRLDAVAIAERDGLEVLPDDDLRKPAVAPVSFVRTSPGGTLHDSHIEEGQSWAKWRCATPNLSSGSEKLSFFHLWRNPRKSGVLADISVRLNPVGHFKCSAEGWGLPGGWWTETRSEAEVSAGLAVWPLWLQHDESQSLQQTIRLARLVATAGVFSDSEQTPINQSVLVSTVRFYVPAKSYVLIEASIVLDHAGSADADFSSGDFRVQCPSCFVAAAEL